MIIQLTTDHIDGDIIPVTETTIGESLIIHYMLKNTLLMICTLLKLLLNGDLQKRLKRLIKKDLKMIKDYDCNIDFI